MKREKSEIKASLNTKRNSKYLTLKKDLKFEILSFINLSDVLSNLFYVNKKTNSAIKDYKSFKLLTHIFNEKLSEIDFSATKEENGDYLKNICAEINLGPDNINFRDIAVFIKQMEFKDNENLTFIGKIKIFIKLTFLRNIFMIFLLLNLIYFHLKYRI